MPERPDMSVREIAGPRLLLRRWRPDDAARVHEVMRDRSMFDFLQLPEPYTPEHAHRFVTELGHEGRDAGTGIGSAVVERSSGRVVGAAALRFGGKYADNPEIGYWIAPDARGRGYATESTRLLVEVGGELGLRRIGLYCDVRNIASAATALRAGFGFEGIERAGAPLAGRGAGDLACFGRLPDDPPEPIAPTFPALPTDGLSDGVLRVRALDERDVAGLTEADNDPVTRANGFGQPPSTPAELLRFSQQAPLQWLVGWRAQCAIVDATSGSYLGGLAIRRNGPPGVGVLGYVVHPAARGRGVASAALRLIAPWLLAHGFDRLELGAKIDNVASQRAALAGGFLAEGVMRGRLRAPDGTLHDEARFYRLPEAPG